MTEENKTTEQPNMSFNLVGHYARDISMECPRPAFESQTDKVAVSMDIGVAVKGLSETRNETAVKVRCEAKTESGDTCYLAEVEYAGVFEHQGFNGEQLMSIMSIDGAALIYPFARRVMMDLVSDSGYRAPMMDLVNFHALFVQAQQQQQAEALKAAETQGAA